MKKKTIAILGSTGSIGQSSLDIIKKSKEFKVELLIANKNYFKIINQIKVFKPNIVIINNKKVFLKIKKKYQKKNLVILNNILNVHKYIKKIDVTVSAIPGIAGLEPTILFTKLSKKILFSYGANQTLLMQHASHKVPGVLFSTGSLGHGLP